MTAPHFATLYALASIIAVPIALAFLKAGARADDRTRNNAAGEEGEGRGVKAFDTHLGAPDK